MQDPRGSRTTDSPGGCLALDNGHYLAYDLDLLRVAAVWKAQDLPFENASMSVNSYPYELRKVGSGQKAAQTKGKFFSKRTLPGVGSGFLISEILREPLEGRAGRVDPRWCVSWDQTPLAHRV